MKGAVYDDKGSGIFNAHLFLTTKKSFVYSSGNGGLFGIPCSKTTDSITIIAQGFDTLYGVVNNNQFNTFYLKSAYTNSSITHQKLLSFSKDNYRPGTNLYYGGESYTSLQENEFLPAAEYPDNSFALNVNCASYSNIRRMLNNHFIVPPDAVRVEEVLNYFDLFDSSAAFTSNGFQFNYNITDVPWNADNKLLLLHFKAPSIPLDSVPPANLVFLVDISGSMDMDNRLPLIKKGLQLLNNNLRSIDTITIIAYGDETRIVLQPTGGDNKQQIRNAIEDLRPGGATPGAAAITMAYVTARRLYNPNATNRIILATDGDFNVGQNSDEELEGLVLANRRSGIYLTCLGVGMGNYKDSKLELLAQKGNGNFAYIDNLQEAEKVIVKEFTQNLYVVALDAMVQCSFDTNYVSGYRLIGFENKPQTDKTGTPELEGGEIGSGNSLVAVYELSVKPNITSNYFIANTSIEYTPVDTNMRKKENFQVLYNYQPVILANNNTKLTTSLVAFSELLKNSVYINNYTWNDFMKYAEQNIPAGDLAQQEFLSLIKKAKTIYKKYKPGEKENN